MAGRPVSRNNVIAGLFVLVSIVLAVAISIMISGVQERLVRTVPYVVRFSIADGAAGLQPDSPVTLGGQQVGRVTSWTFNLGPAGEPVAVDVRVAVRADLTLFEDAWFFLERPLLGTLSAINIARTGDGSEIPAPQGGDPRLQPGEVIIGHVAPPSFLAQAGYGPEQSRQLQEILADGAAVMERMERITGQIEGELGPTLESVRTIADDIGDASARIRTKVPEWTDRVDSVLAQTDQAAGRLSPLADQLSAAITDADQIIGEARQIIAENRPQLDSIIDNLDTAAARLSARTFDQLDATLASAQAGADEFARAGREFNLLLQRESPNIERILANLRLAADQIKLTGIEVRRNPWRLLYSPSTRELESELFYDAARTYAQAVSDLRAASEALQATGRTEPATPEAVEATHRITRQLNDAFQRYQDAERALLQQMIQRRQ